MIYRILFPVSVTNTIYEIKREHDYFNVKISKSIVMIITTKFKGFRRLELQV